MTVRVLKALAVVCLALAIASIIASVRSTLRAGKIQGPSALVVLPSGEVWLGVDDALWRISAQGQLLDAQPIRATGLPGAAANFVRSPDGSIVASVRGDPTLYFLEAANARIFRRVNPQWPAELQKHGARAINFAFDAAGRVAIATGGGDAVALFEPDGRFVARSAPGRYDFTNGLWWSDEGLWTTDTNRFTLRVLDGATLLQRREHVLGEAVGGSYLGPARARPAPPGAGMPRAAMIRFQGDMTHGGVSLVGADARVTVLPHSVDMEPRDVDWLGDELLATDGLSFAVLRWSADRRAQPPFGDAVVQQRLRALAGERAALRKDYMRWLIAACIALAAGMLFAGLVPWLARRAQPVIALDLSQLGTPRVGHMDLLRLHLRLAGWLLLMAVPLLLIELAGPLGLKARLGDSWPFVLAGFLIAAAVLALLSIPWLLRRIKRLSRLPEFEPALNQRAMLQLKAQGQVVARTLRNGEQVLEAFSLMPGQAWWVLTSQRLLAFQPAMFDATVAVAHELSVVRGVATEPGKVVPKAWWQRAAGDSAWLEVTIEGQSPLAGSVGSPVLAARLAQRIDALAAALRAQAPPRSPAAPGLGADRLARRRRRFIASALLPGLGQWQQRRAGEAIAFVGAWAVTVIFGSFPMLWTLVEPFTGVSAIDVTVVVSLHLMLSALAAADAWRSEALASK